MVQGQKEQGATVVMVSHSMDDVANLAERVIVMDHGKVAMDGTPVEIFGRVDELKKLSLSVPVMTELAFELKKAGLSIPEGVLREEELAEAILKNKR